MVSLDGNIFVPPLSCTLHLPAYTSTRVSGVFGVRTQISSKSYKSPGLVTLKVDDLTEQEWQPKPYLILCR